MFPPVDEFFELDLAAVVGVHVLHRIIQLPVGEVTAGTLGEIAELGAVKVARVILVDCVKDPFELLAVPRAWRARGAWRLAVRRDARVALGLEALLLGKQIADHVDWFWVHVRVLEQVLDPLRRILGKAPVLRSQPVHFDVPRLRVRIDTYSRVRVAGSRQVQRRAGLLGHLRHRRTVRQGVVGLEPRLGQRATQRPPLVGVEHSVAVHVELPRDQQVFI